MSSSDPITLTPEQAEIAKGIANGEPLEGNAVAGSGKTKTLATGAAGIPPSRRVLAVAFGKANQLDLEKRLPDYVDCRTFNGLGHRTWMKHTGLRLELDGRKTGRITTEFCKHFNVQHLWAPIKDLVGKAKLTGIVPAELANIAIGLEPDIDSVWEALAFAYGIPCNKDIIEGARQVLRESIQAALKGLIDFDDQLYLAVVFRARFQVYDQVLVDEAQDLSPLQHVMVERSTGNAIASLGDPHQSIMAFRGAVNNSMAELADRFNLKSLPLTFNFRCGRSIIKEAQAHVPHIQAWSGATEGSVGRLAQWSPTVFQPSDAVLCRNNAPLISLAFRCIRARVGVKFAGRDIGRALGTIIKGLCPHENLMIPLDTFVGKLTEWQMLQTATALAKDDPAKAEAITDRCESIFAIVEGCPDARTAKDIFDECGALFDKTMGMLTLSTIHKAKGLEWDRVYFLDRWRLPSKAAKVAALKGNPDPLQQESNLAYVGITRARFELTYVDLKGCEGANQG